MEKQLNAILGKAIYERIRSTCKGWIKVDINNDICYIQIKFDDIEFNVHFYDVAERILNGSFTSERIAEAFINDWKRYYFKIQEKKLFYMY